jgi:hypothetical protein
MAISLHGLILVSAIYPCAPGDGNERVIVQNVKALPVRPAPRTHGDSRCSAAASAAIPAIARAQLAMRSEG